MLGVNAVRRNSHIANTENTFPVTEIDLLQGAPGFDMANFGLNITVSPSTGPTQPASTLGAHQLAMKQGIGL